MIELVAKHSKDGLISIAGIVDAELITSSAHLNTITALQEFWDLALGFGDCDLDAGEDFTLVHEWE